MDIYVYVYIEIYKNCLEMYTTLFFISFWHKRPCSVSGALARAEVRVAPRKMAVDDLEFKGGRPPWI